jgi:hypothetical protein
MKIKRIIYEGLKCFLLFPIWWTALEWLDCNSGYSWWMPVYFVTGIIFATMYFTKSKARGEK